MLPEPAVWARGGPEGLRAPSQGGLLQTPALSRLGGAWVLGTGGHARWWRLPVACQRGRGLGMRKREPRKGEGLGQGH